ncbi:MAG: addiction module antidote protein [Beijerinckiaceae bacterium]
MMSTDENPLGLAPFDPAEFLTTPDRVAYFLEAVFEDGDGDEIKQALGVVARAKGMTKIAKETGLTREALYKALQADGDPKFSTLLAVMRALGLRLVAKPAKVKARSRKTAA